MSREVEQTMNTKPIEPVAQMRLARPVRVVLAICCSLSVAFAVSSPTAGAAGSHLRAHESSLTGAWSGKYSGAYRGTFTLQWTQSGSTLSGTIKLSSTRGGKVPLKGTVRGNTIRFGTVGSAAITYTGSVSGKSMSGSYKTPGGGGPWSAHKTS
jgi:hypothetical protein